MILSRWLCAAAILVLCSGKAQAMDNLQVGDPAPTFNAQDQTGAEWQSSSHVGKKILVVYFYPADMTGGCTKQACKFRDNMSQLQDLGVEVIGVSGDTVKNHQLFQKAHQLNYTLLADTKGQVAHAFGVPFTAGEKSFKTMIDGQEEVLVRLGTAKRWTFVIDKNGKIAYKNENVNPELDTQQVTEVIRDLKQKS
jgi:peroxiredoxin Q/BCP